MAAIPAQLGREKMGTDNSIPSDIEVAQTTLYPAAKSGAQGKIPQKTAKTGELFSTIRLTR
ncbi:MAG: hypothetical protein MPK05_07245, partial [Gammaproteobacteria bacterium]|nr:hypothetical protein [Gammaproteobacteria bacterium]